MTPDAAKVLMILQSGIRTGSMTMVMPYLAAASPVSRVTCTTCW